MTNQPKENAPVMKPGEVRELPDGSLEALPDPDQELSEEEIDTDETQNPMKTARIQVTKE